MPRLLCPHCDRPVKANPLGRWFARFICPRCRGPLQFDKTTNIVGAAAGALGSYPWA